MRILVAVSLLFLVLSFSATAEEKNTTTRTILLSDDPNSPVNNPGLVAKLKKLSKQLDLGYKDKSDKRFGIKLRMNLYEAKQKEIFVQRVYLKPYLGQGQTLKIVLLF
jgi:hypothetical protein